MSRFVNERLEKELHKTKERIARGPITVGHLTAFEGAKVSERCRVNETFFTWLRCVCRKSSKAPDLRNVNGTSEQTGACFQDLASDRLERTHPVRGVRPAIEVRELIDSSRASGNAAG